MDEFITALSGGLAGAISSFLIYPMDTILVKYQSDYHEKATCNSSNNNSNNSTFVCSENYDETNSLHKWNLNNKQRKKGRQHNDENLRNKMAIDQTGKKDKFDAMNYHAAKKNESRDEINANEDIYNFNEIYNNVNNIYNPENSKSKCLIKKKINEDIKSVEQDSADTIADFSFFPMKNNDNNQHLEITKIYKGVAFKMLESLMKNFCFFYWNTLLKKAYKKKYGEISIYTNFLLATLSGYLSLIITSPLEVITTNLQTSKMSLKKIFISILKEKGISGFYSGLMASVILCVNPAINYTIFDYLKVSMQQFKNDNSKSSVLQSEDYENEFMYKFDKPLVPLSASESFFLGAISKTITTFMTYPYIRAKAFVQTRVLNSQRQKKRHNIHDKQPSRNTKNEKEIGDHGQNSKLFKKHLDYTQKSSLNYCISTNSLEQQIKLNNSLNDAESQKIQSVSFLSPSVSLSSVDIVKAASFCLSDTSEEMPSENDERYQLIKKLKNDSFCSNESFCSEIKV